MDQQHEHGAHVLDHGAARVVVEVG